MSRRIVDHYTSSTSAQFDIPAGVRDDLIMQAWMDFSPNGARMLEPDPAVPNDMIDILSCLPAGHPNGITYMEFEKWMQALNHYGRAANGRPLPQATLHFVGWLLCTDDGRYAQRQALEIAEAENVGLPLRQHHGQGVVTFEKIRFQGQRFTWN